MRRRLIARALGTHPYDEIIGKLNDIQSELIIHEHFKKDEKAKLNDAFDEDAENVNLLDEYYEGQLDMSQFEEYSPMDLELAEPSEADLSI